MENVNYETELLQNRYDLDTIFNIENMAMNLSIDNYSDPSLGSDSIETCFDMAFNAYNIPAEDRLLLKDVIETSMMKR